MEIPNLDKLFNPSGIAMIGASASFGKWGFIILFNLLNGGFEGPVYPVNPKEKRILDLDCYPSVKDITHPVDIAMITTPSYAVLPLIDECGERGVPFVILVTSNFSETGPEGAALEMKVVERARKYGIRIVGPNTMGIFSASQSLHALMPPNMPIIGPVSMFSQSGNLGTQMLAWGEDEGVGFEKFVCSGNEGDLTALEYLGYFGQDEKTKVILAYLEGIEPDSDFVPLARDVSRKKPVVVLKGGRTAAGGIAALSHSGAMAGSTRIYRAAFRQSGVIEVQSSQALMDCAKVFSHLPTPQGGRVAILTRGGGWGVITADACEEAGLSVPPLPDSIKQKIDKILPEYWSRGNPVDMVAVIGMEPFVECLNILAEWDGIDSIIEAGGIGGMKMKTSPKSRLPAEVKGALAKAFQLQDGPSQDSIMDLMSNIIKRTGKPIINLILGTLVNNTDFTNGYSPVSFPTPERAVRALRAMVGYRQFLNSPE